MNTQLTKRALFSKGALSAGVGLGALALFAQRVSADTPFTAFAFPATGAPTPRTMSDRLAEVINVKDFGAVGNGQTNDTDAIQAAFDAAFGPANNPHGAANSHLNRPVFFPNGLYLSGTLTLTDVVGGHIFGCGCISTMISYTGSVPGENTQTSLIKTDGLSNCLIEKLGLSMTGRSNLSNTVCLNLDCDTGSVGLSNNMLLQVGVSNANYGILIGHSGNGGGQSMSLISCDEGNCYYGIKNESAEANITGIGGGPSECIIGIWMTGGSFAAGGYQFAGANPTAPQLDIQHDSPGIFSVFGSRSESAKFCNITNGKLIVHAFSHTSALASYSIKCTSPAQVSLVSCLFGEVNTAGSGYITGSADIFLRSVEFARDGQEPSFVDFTGRIYEYLSKKIFTYSTLPSPAGEGLTVNMSDANTNTWGANVTEGGGNNHVLVRWNGSNWTVAGK